MASPVNTKKPSKGSLFQKLPRISTSVWILIIVVLVLVVSIPMITSYMDQTAQQSVLNANLAKLKSQYTGLQQQLSSQADVTTEINRLKSDVDSARQFYGTACDSIETSQKLMDLAWEYDITIITISANNTPIKISGADYSGTSYVLNMKGQVANFQNYLIALGNNFPSKQNRKCADTTFLYSGNA